MPTRDALGKMVRDVWIRWAKQQPSPKSSWLVEYEHLSEPDKEADRMIGEELWHAGFEAGEDAGARNPYC